MINRKLQAALVRCIIIPLILVIVFHMAIISVAFLRSISMRTDNPHTTSVMTRTGEYKTPSFMPLNEIPSDLILAILYVEDPMFWRHNGIDLDYIYYAIEANERLGYKTYGASTVTQQFVRTCCLSSHKSYLRKYIEVVFALVFDAVLSKNRILELYMNYIEWGDGIFGILDASKEHFGKLPSALDLEEKISLITIMPNPVAVSPDNIPEEGYFMDRFNYIRINIYPKVIGRY